MPGNFDQIVAGAATVIVNLDNGGEIVAGGGLLDDSYLVAAAFDLCDLDGYSGFGKWCGKAIASRCRLISLDGFLLDRKAADREVDLVVNAAVPIHLSGV